MAKKKTTRRKRKTTTRRKKAASRRKTTARRRRPPRRTNPKLVPNVSKKEAIEASALCYRVAYGLQWMKDGLGDKELSEEESEIVKDESWIGVLYSAGAILASVGAGEVISLDTWFSEDVDISDSGDTVAAIKRAIESAKGYELEY